MNAIGSKGSWDTSTGLAGGLDLRSAAGDAGEWAVSQLGSAVSLASGS